MGRFEKETRDILAGFPVDQPVNESHTGDDLIRPIPICSAGRNI